ncbi:helix-turn-helix domain-containing protein [Paenibacillus ehimensis]|uniref:helix-turn-helix domain-containing protein n=1 Tax=Paenibacillus ehimensis TaxID=79264 RepID=UPI000FDADE35|nr:helix-turn-helix domain-containing protein [Paenibacillus ehimensis]
MKDSKADLILHPVRFRILGLLVGGRSMSALEMAEALPDIPQATLYRHLNKLYKSGVLTVANERQVRGTVEKIYALPDKQAVLSAADLAHADRDDHLRYFMTFVASLVDDYGRYLRQPSVDLEADGVGYRQVPLYLTDEEFAEFVQAIRPPIREAMANSPEPGRRRRLFTTIIIPEPQASDSEGKE